LRPQFVSLAFRRLEAPAQALHAVLQRRHPRGGGAGGAGFLPETQSQRAVGLRGIAAEGDRSGTST